MGDVAAAIIGVFCIVGLGCAIGFGLVRILQCFVSHDDDRVRDDPVNTQV
jgi:hypothetical protein